MSTYEELKDQIEQIGRFESLVQLPAERVMNLGYAWAAAASVSGHRLDGFGQTEYEALQELLKSLLLKKN